MSVPSGLIIPREAGRLQFKQFNRESENPKYPQCILLYFTQKWHGCNSPNGKPQLDSALSWSTKEKAGTWDFSIKHMKNLIQSSTSGLLDTKKELGKEEDISKFSPLWLYFPGMLGLINCSTSPT